MATEDQAPTASRSVDQAFVTEFGDRYLEAWNSHDPDKLLALMTKDIVYDDSAWPTTMRGHGDVREFLQYTWRAFPDLRFEVVDGPFLHPTEPRAAYHWKGFATHTGPIDPPGLAPTGKHIEMQGVDLHEYRDGALARLRIVFDMAQAMRDLGALPPTGSRAERLTMGLVNVQGKVAKAVGPRVERWRASRSGGG